MLEKIVLSRHVRNTYISIYLDILKHMLCAPAALYPQECSLYSFLLEAVT